MDITFFLQLPEPCAIQVSTCQDFYSMLQRGEDARQQTRDKYSNRSVAGSYKAHAVVVLSVRREEGAAVSSLILCVRTMHGCSEFQGCVRACVCACARCKISIIQKDVRMGACVCAMQGLRECNVCECVLAYVVRFPFGRVSFGWQRG